MILKMNNKEESFYSYMGKFFGSRIVQTETKDRIYDDNNKIWYLYIDANTKKVYSFISICDGMIKNVYSTNDTYLKELLEEIKRDFVILPSIVTNLYENVYLDAGLKIVPLDNYKHFILVRGDADGRN